MRSVFASVAVSRHRPKPSSGQITHNLSAAGASVFVTSYKGP